MLINAKAQELSYSYIKKIYEFLNGFFKYAKQRGIITTNPCDAVIVPKEEHVAVKTREIDILTPKEISKLQTRPSLPLSPQHRDPVRGSDRA